MVAEAAERQKEEPQALEAIVKQCGTCSHWRFMGDKLKQPWGFCTWDNGDIIEVLPFYIVAGLDNFFSTDEIEGTNCGAWEDRHATVKYPLPSFITGAKVNEEAK